MAKEKMMKNAIVMFEDSIECNDDNQNRPEWKHRVYALDEHLYFDYWDKDEWEISIHGNPNRKECEMYFRIMTTISMATNLGMHWTEDIPSFIDNIKRLIDYAKWDMRTPKIAKWLNPTYNTLLKLGHKYEE